MYSLKLREDKKEKANLKQEVGRYKCEQNGSLTTSVG